MRYEWSGGIPVLLDKKDKPITMNEWIYKQASILGEDEYAKLTGKDSYNGFKNQVATVK